MIKIQNLKMALSPQVSSSVIDFLNLEVICNLVLVF